MNLYSLHLNLQTHPAFAMSAGMKLPRLLPQSAMIYLFFFSMSHLTLFDSLRYFHSKKEWTVNLYLPLHTTHEFIDSYYTAIFFSHIFPMLKFLAYLHEVFRGTELYY